MGLPVSTPILEILATPLFKATTHRNYAKKCVTMLYHYRQKEQFLWNRFINMKGGTGNNISCDLHLNILRGMGSNISPQRIKKAGQSIEVVWRVCDAFEKQTTARIHSDNHPYPACGKDFDTVLTVLINKKSFVEIENIKHSNLQRVFHECTPSHSYSNQSGPTLAYRNKQLQEYIQITTHILHAFGKDFDTVLTVLINKKSFVEIENGKYQTFQFTKSIPRMYTESQLFKPIWTNFSL